MSLGKNVRLRRIFNDPSGRLLSVAVDHFVGYQKAMTDGLADLPKTIAQVVAAKPDAVTMMEGAAKHCWSPYAGKVALIIQLGCFTPDDRIAERIGSVEGVVRAGADAVAISIGVRGPLQGSTSVSCQRPSRRQSASGCRRSHTFTRAFTTTAPV